jgi:hypothetical protein
MADFRYRHFIYLDSGEILNTATIMTGGDVEEEMHTLKKSLGGKIGLKFGHAALGANIGGQGERNHQKEWKLRRTAYDAADRVLRELAPKDIIGDNLLNIPENRVIQCDIDLKPLPIADSPASSHARLQELLRPWWKRIFPDPAAKVERRRIADYAQVRLTEALIFNGKSNELSKIEVLVTLDPQWILDPSGFDRRATVVAQVAGVKRPGEELVLTDDVTGAAYRFQPLQDRTNGSVIPEPSRDNSELALGEAKTKPCNASVVLRPIVIFK